MGSGSRQAPALWASGHCSSWTVHGDHVCMEDGIGVLPPVEAPPRPGTHAVFVPASCSVTTQLPPWLSVTPLTPLPGSESLGAGSWALSCLPHPQPPAGPFQGHLGKAPLGTFAVPPAGRAKLPPSLASTWLLPGTLSPSSAWTVLGVLLTPPRGLSGLPVDSLPLTPILGASLGLSQCRRLQAAFPDPQPEGAPLPGPSADAPPSPG